MMSLNQIFIASEIYWVSIPHVKCGGRAANDTFLGSRPGRSLPKYWSPSSANLKYTSKIMDTFHSPLFATANKYYGNVVPEDAQIAGPFLIPHGLKFFGHTNSSIVSLFSS